MNLLSNLLFFIGRVILLLPAAMLPALLIAIYNAETKAMQGFGICILACALIGLILTRLKGTKKNIYAKEGFLVVGLAWILISFIGAFPLYFSGSIGSFVDCLFESISCFTATGASILDEVEILPKSILYWRTFCNWFGGMGVLVFLLAITMKTGGGTVFVLNAESPGPSKGKLRPKLKDSAMILYTIYIVLTILEIVLLLAGGMSLFDSVTNTFSCAATGGTNIKNASIGYYNNLYFEIVIGIFMMLFGINFTFFYFIAIRNFRDAFKLEEMKVYLLILVSAFFLITMDLVYTQGNKISTAFRMVFFNATSVLTTTGLSTCDITLWPESSQAIMIILMFIGGCAGSTSGGMKVSRIMILFKSAKCGIKRMIHPNATQIVRIDEKLIEEETVSKAKTYLFVYILIVTFSIVLISFNNTDLVTASSSVIACINNVGFGLGKVGPSGNYGSYSDFSKLLLAFNMLIGRLEIFPIIMVFSPSVWRNR